MRAEGTTLRAMLRIAMRPNLLTTFFFTWIEYNRIALSTLGLIGKFDAVAVSGQSRGKEIRLG